MCLVARKSMLASPPSIMEFFLTKETGQGTISENRASMYEEAPSNQMMIGWYWLHGLYQSVLRLKIDFQFFFQPTGKGVKGNDKHDC